LTENNPSEIAGIAMEEAILSLNEPLTAIPKEKTTTVFPVPCKETVQEPKKEVNKAENAVVSLFSTQNNLESESSNNRVAVSTTQPKTEKEIGEENTKTKEKTEAASAKEPPIIVSKDTTVCENSIVKLFVLNAKNVRWSTGERKNTIYVNPSSDEQYSATFTTGNNQDTTVFIHIKCIRCSELFIPNAFTPNGDGLNDLFVAQSEEEYAYFEMSIYSRDGQILFLSKDIKHGWDGRYKGAPQPHGSYIYIIRYKDANGKMNEKKGNFLLLLQ